MTLRECELGSGLIGEGIVLDMLRGGGKVIGHFFHVAGHQRNAGQTNFELGEIACRELCSQRGKMLYGIIVDSTRLPQLPLVVDGDGTVRASGDFAEPVGPSWWTM